MAGALHGAVGKGIGKTNPKRGRQVYYKEEMDRIPWGCRQGAAYGQGR